VRAALLRHLAADNDDQPKDFCDHHGGYVEAGTTRPYAPGSRFRLCATCVTEGEAEVASRETFCPECHYLTSFHVNGRCPEEHEARARSGAQ